MKIISSNSINIIAFFLFIIVGTASALVTKCPFQFIYVLGDGLSDPGNSVRVLPFGPLLPPNRYPYGKTYPGYPTGRWSDGLVGIDYYGKGLGLPNLKPYLGLGLNLLSGSYDGIVFSVDGSTILSNEECNLLGLNLLPSNIPLNTQLDWLKQAIKPPLICLNPQECSRRKLSNSLVIFSFVEAKDIAYLLEQGKSVPEIQSYLPHIVETQVNAAREVIKLGATRIIYSKAGTLGCYPYIQTMFYTTNATAYGRRGCLLFVNNLVRSHNLLLETAFDHLKSEFPHVQILVADAFASIFSLIDQITIPGFVGPNPALKACCGIGGNSNYDKTRVCGSPGVPVCSDPNQSFYWDGSHFTQQVYAKLADMLLPGALPVLNCTST